MDLNNHVVEIINLIVFTNTMVFGNGSIPRYPITLSLQKWKCTWTNAFKFNNDIIKSLMRAISL